MHAFFKSALRFYVYGNFHIALGAAALSDIVSRLMLRPIPIWLAMFIACSTFCLYNLQRIYASWKLSRFENHTTKRHDWVDKQRNTMSILTLLVFFYGCFLFFQHADLREWLWVLFIPTALSIAYALPILPGATRWIRLRDVPGVKIFLVAFVWAWIIVIWVVCQRVEECNNNIPGTPFKIMRLNDVLHCFSFVFAYIFAITIPFDIRDYKIDGIQVKSIPVLVGIRGSIVIAIAALFSIVVMSIYLSVIDQHNRMKWICIALFCLPTALAIAYSTPKRHDYYFSLLIDGLLIVLWIVILVADQFDQSFMA